MKTQSLLLFLLQLFHFLFHDTFMLKSVFTSSSLHHLFLSLLPTSSSSWLPCTWVPRHRPDNLLLLLLSAPVSRYRGGRHGSDPCGNSRQHALLDETTAAPPPAAVDVFIRPDPPLLQICPSLPPLSHPLHLSLLSLHHYVLSLLLLFCSLLVCNFTQILILILLQTCWKWQKQVIHDVNKCWFQEY